MPIAILLGVDLAALVAWIILAAFVAATERIWYPAIDRITGAIPLVGGLAKSAIMGIVHAMTGDYVKIYNGVSLLFGAFWVAWAKAVILPVYALWDYAVASSVRIAYGATTGAVNVVEALVGDVRHAIAGLTAHLGALAGWVHSRVSALEHGVARLDRTVYDGLTRELAALEHGAIRDLRRGEAALEHELGHVVVPDLAKLTREYGLVAAEAGAATLALKELSSLRCSNVGTMAKFLCGLDPAILSMLLGFLSSALVLELLDKAHVSLSDPFSWLASAADELETIASTF